MLVKIRGSSLDVSSRCLSRKGIGQPPAPDPHPAKRETSDHLWDSEFSQPWGRPHSTWSGLEGFGIFRDGAGPLLPVPQPALATTTWNFSLAWDHPLKSKRLRALSLGIITSGRVTEFCQSWRWQGHRAAHLTRGQDSMKPSPVHRASERLTTLY